MSREEIVDAVTHVVWKREFRKRIFARRQSRRKMREKRADPELAAWTNQVPMSGFFMRYVS